MISSRTQKILNRYMRGIEEDSNGCHVWTKFRDAKGYGRIQIGKKAERAHRVAYRLFVGPIPPGGIVRHKCDNPSCANWSHLEIGTHADNVRDRDSRGRTAVGLRIPRCKLSDQDVKDLRVMWQDRKQMGLKQSDIASKFNITVCAA